MVGLLRFEDAVQEAFAVAVLPCSGSPELVNDDESLLANSFVVPTAVLPVSEVAEAPAGAARPDRPPASPAPCPPPTRSRELPGVGRPTTLTVWPRPAPSTTLIHDEDAMSRRDDAMRRLDSRREDVGRTGRKSDRRSHRFRPQITPLEGLALLASFVVSSISDGTNVSGSLLRGDRLGQRGQQQRHHHVQLALQLLSYTITLTAGQLELSKTEGTLTITGPGAYLLSINGNNASRVFQVDTGVTAAIDGLTITGGKVSTGSGGGILNQGNLTLNGDAISDNVASTGGGIFTTAVANGSASITVLNSTINANTADFCGGLDSATSTDKSTISTTITNSTVTGNSASSSQVDSGILIQVSGGTTTSDSLSLSDSTVAANNQGGIFLQDSAGSTVSLLAQGSLISGNSDPDITNSEPPRSTPVLTTTSSATAAAACPPPPPTTTSSGPVPVNSTRSWARWVPTAGPPRRSRCSPAAPPLCAGVAVSGVTADEPGDAAAVHPGHRRHEFAAP